jgi:hypothetical protein
VLVATLIAMGEHAVATKFGESYNTGTRAHTARGDGGAGIGNETNSHESKHRYVKPELLKSNKGPVTVDVFMGNVDTFLPSVTELEPYFANEPEITHEVWRVAQVMLRDHEFARHFSLGNDIVLVSSKRWDRFKEEHPDVTDFPGDIFLPEVSKLHSNTCFGSILLDLRPRYVTGKTVPPIVQNGCYSCRFHARGCTRPDGIIPLRGEAF